MISDRVDLYIQRVDLVGDDARLKTVLTQTPGVLEVRQLSDGPDSIARRVELDRGLIISDFAPGGVGPEEWPIGSIGSGRSIARDLPSSWVDWRIPGLPMNPEALDRLLRVVDLG